MSDMFLVTRGAYSSMMPVCVFTTRELADTWVTEMSKRDEDEDYEVWPVDVDPPIPAFVPKVEEPDELKRRERTPEEERKRKEQIKKFLKQEGKL